MVGFHIGTHVVRIDETYEHSGRRLPGLDHVQVIPHRIGTGSDENRVFLVWIVAGLPELFSK